MVLGLFHLMISHNAHDWVQFSHRGMAFITFIWIMITFIHAIKNYSDNRTVRYGYTASFILVILQVITVLYQS